ncbi:ABC transporter permease [Siphonobacter sp. SORGH_AS_1065]|uniref:ABC transporter permease n=1 Tax=Siphonobacter sp. SORGH_AS_1065 TaxID=3041795 RepID=UPI00278675AA|nr:ABC transporter permease [Siphonobacter sp. SORGH_AS_1065]MDQ1088328.1 hypothetical protein [Siphonobacter sp. SORGH_AS_1065]
MLLSYIPASFRIEILKTRNTSALWLTFIGSLFAPSILFIGYLSKPEIGYAGAKINAWDLFIGRCWQAEIAVFIPFYAVLINSLIVNIEHRSNTWKYVFTQPFPKSSVWVGKILLIQSLILLHFLVFNSLTLVAGGILALIDPNYGFANHIPSFDIILKFIVKTFIATLGVSGIHYWLATRIKNIIVPIGIALMGIVLSSVLIMQQWKYVDWFPYAFPLLSSMRKSNDFLVLHEWVSLGYFVVLNVLGYLDISRRNMG